MKLLFVILLGLTLPAITQAITYISTSNCKVYAVKIAGEELFADLACTRGPIKVKTPLTSRFSEGLQFAVANERTVAIEAIGGAILTIKNLEVYP